MVVVMVVLISHFHYFGDLMSSVTALRVAIDSSICANANSISKLSSFSDKTLRVFYHTKLRIGTFGLVGERDVSLGSPLWVSLVSLF